MFSFEGNGEVQMEWRRGYTKSVLRNIKQVTVARKPYGALYVQIIVSISEHV